MQYEQFEQLDEFFDYKNQLMEDLLTREDIVALIDENTKLSNAKSLVYKQVFPTEYIPSTIEEGRVFICCDVDIQKPLGKTYLLPTLFVWVFAHKSKMFLPEGGVRVDKLCSKIAGALNGSMKYGLGELSLNTVKRYAPMTDFVGKTMIFYATDFNRLHNPNKAIPANRKRG